MDVLVVGLGLMGGSLARELRDAGHSVSGSDASAAHASEALSLGLVDRIVRWEDAVGIAGLVVLATPVGGLCALLPRVLDRLAADATVTDLGSTKAMLARAVEGHPRRVQYVAAHPMAGTENSGPSAASKGLFTGRTAVLCDCERSGAMHLARVSALFEGLRMRLVHMQSDAHDAHAAFVSHLSHISSFVLANTVLDVERDEERIFDLAGGGFESTVRLAKSSPAMWAPIFEQNQENLVHALKAYRSHLDAFLAAIEGQRWDETRALMASANRIRPVLEDLKRRAR